MTGPRLRFAPSPTGFLHVGSARAALYNWLFARQQGGELLLRIEDTDEARDREEWVEGIFEALRWLGLDWDGEPVRQSTRAARHAEAAATLEAAGRTYWCDCTRDAIDQRAHAAGRPPGYDGFCRDRGLGPGEGRAMRFATPTSGATVVHDLIRGEPTFDNAVIDDPIIVRSTGKAMFVLANVVDDIDMAITHVVRGEDHLPTTPKYLLLWEALGGGELPVFAHLPMLVNEKRQKLSKRRDSVAVEEFRAEGFLPEVMVNYLALLGWAPTDGRERLSVDELVREFRLTDVNSSPAFFDLAKLRAFNGDTIRAMAPDDFALAAGPWLSGPLDPRLVPLVQERVVTLAEVAPMVDFIDAEPVIDPASWDKAMAIPAAASVLERAADAYQALDDWQAATLKEALVAVGESLDLNLKRAQAPVRVAVTGRSVGPPLFESLEVLGREVTLRRLQAARARLG